MLMLFYFIEKTQRIVENGNKYIAFRSMTALDYLENLCEKTKMKPPVSLSQINCLSLLMHLAVSQYGSVLGFYLPFPFYYPSQRNLETDGSESFQGTLPLVT